MQYGKELSLKIQKLYSEQLSMAEADDAAGRLVSFFKILEDSCRYCKTAKTDQGGIGGYFSLIMPVSPLLQFVWGCRYISHTPSPYCKCMLNEIKL